jgi:chromosome segregation ATPase
MEENLSALRAELAALEEEEARLSAERRHLHRQIDFGFASETTRAREREVSDNRRELHGRIDMVRESLGMQAGPKRAPAEAGLDQMTRGIGELERIGEATQRIDEPIADLPIL